MHIAEEIRKKRLIEEEGFHENDNANIEINGRNYTILLPSKSRFEKDPEVLPENLVMKDSSMNEPLISKSSTLNLNDSILKTLLELKKNTRRIKSTIRKIRNGS